MALLHLLGGVRVVQTRTTSVPKAGTYHGAVRYPTKYTVRYANRWCRVWQHSDGSRYITHAYMRTRVSALPGEAHL